MVNMKLRFPALFLALAFAVFQIQVWALILQLHQTDNLEIGQFAGVPLRSTSL